ncbi:MAG: ATP-binding protein, partial [Lachnoclostridium sp.]|nr:ATP-binding protein [Lachnoclostridium sp.]
ISEQYGEYFGFTEEEIETALQHYHLESQTEEIRNWYNGYLFGTANVYNPWSAILYIEDKHVNENKFPTPYWSNTSSNSIIRELIEISDETTKKEIEMLIQCGTVTKPIHEDIVYSEIRQDMNHFWNFLFFTGYLKKIEETFADRTLIYTMMIPNEEIMYIYKRKIREWFHEKVKVSNPNILVNAIIDKNENIINRELNNRLMDMISYHDTAENFYHGFLLGILSNLQRYQVKSNRESGFDRSDIYMKRIGSNYGSAVFEVKVAKHRGELEKRCVEALAQIKEMNYVHDLEEEGYKDITRYGVAFYGKECLVKSGD